MKNTDKLTLMLLFLAEKNILIKLLKYTTPELLEEDTKMGYVGLSYFFYWDETLEGAEYWHKVHAEFAEYLRDNT